MKRLPRDPIRFDLANALVQFGRSEKLSLRDPSLMDGFVEQMRNSVRNSLSNETLLHGLRTQGMFEALVLSLGALDFFKQEDSGEIYASDDTIKVPDFRLILRDGSQMLVEVKNFYQTNDPMQMFEFDGDYLDGLVRYATMMNCTLFLAIYWVKWNIWTLVLPETFSVDEDKRRISLLQALQANQMIRIGDYLVGTKFPLRLIMYSDKTQPRTLGPEHSGEFTVGSVEIYCDKQLITDPVERRIATYLMFYGKWNYETEAKMSGNEIDAVEHRWIPNHDEGQGFELVGSLSEMFSKFYRFSTQEAGEIDKLHLDVTPGSLGQLIPENHQGDALPLWRFRVHPSERSNRQQ